jgi:hypothetical protein
VPLGDLVEKISNLGVRNPENPQNFSLKDKLTGRLKTMNNFSIE